MLLSVPSVVGQQGNSVCGNIKRGFNDKKPVTLTISYIEIVLSVSSGPVGTGGTLTATKIGLNVRIVLR